MFHFPKIETPVSDTKQQITELKALAYVLQLYALENTFCYWFVDLYGSFKQMNKKKGSLNSFNS